MTSPPRNLPRIPRAHSYSHPERRPSWYAEHLEWARIDLQTALLSHSPPSPLPTTSCPPLKSPKSPKFPLRLRPRSPPPPYDSYNDYHYVEAVPNLELHSAAAEGNVGLVHYALTHGQPINSILHGLQPIHAAAAGGSLSALRMLIDRGADVNAPRLPRRYSSEKNKEAPSVGVAGATPLHFAAANGHASVVQLLLTNGAISDKADQMGQTPEGLAEENGHAGVLDVLRVYDSLRRPGSSRAASASMSQSDAMSIRSGHASFGGPSRPSSPSASIHEEAETASLHSRKGKERADSHTSDQSGLAKMRKSIGGFLGRRSRKSSLAMSPVHPETSHGQVRPSMEEVPVEEPPDSEMGALSVQDGEDGQGPSNRSPYITSPASSHHSLLDTNAQAGPSHTVIPEHEPYSAPPAITNLARTASTASNESHNSLLRTPPPIMAPPRERKASHSSRRPSLPSIFEKAVHPGQAFRAALGKHRHGADTEDELEGGHYSDTVDGSMTIPEKPRSVSHGSHTGFFVRGRQKSGELSDRSRRYTSGLKGLFRRPQSPPSRSPSPPLRDHTGHYPTQVDPDELNKEIERLRTAKSELERERQMERRHSYDEGDDGSLVKPQEVQMRQMPKSAPAGKTRFFENLDARHVALSQEPDTASAVAGSSSTASAAMRKPNRSRTGSEVIAPSPLANEWPRDSDSDSTSRSRVRRVKTEGAKQSSFASSSRLSIVTGAPAPSPRMTKPRSATLPSSPAGYRSPLRTASGSKLVGVGGVDWDDAPDLRSGVLIRESVKKSEEGEISPVLSVERLGMQSLRQEKGDGEEEEQEEDEVYHDARDATSPVDGEAEEAPVRSSQVQVVRVEDPVDGSIELASPPKPTRRFRGASIGSVNSTASRLSTAPGSSVRFSGGSDDGSSERHARFQDGIGMALQPTAMIPVPAQTAAASSSMFDTRPRGKSVSSIGTTTTLSGSGYQYSYPLSTPATSITPPSTISITLGGKGPFPPVPEHGTLQHHDSLPSADAHRESDIAKLIRSASSRAEVEDIVRQAGDGVMHLAQMPESSQSSRDLAAQLAAFGDSVAMQEEMERQQRRERRERRRMYRALSEKSRLEAEARGTARDGQQGQESGTSVGEAGGQGRLQDEDAASTSTTSKSTQRTPSLMSYSGRSESWRSAQSAVSGPSRRDPSVREYPAPILIHAEAPRSALPRIDSIYDRRAALHRENMAKLSAAHGLSRPPTIGSTGRHHSGGHRPSVYTAAEAQAHDNAPRGAPAWLMGATPAVNRETGSLYGSIREQGGAGPASGQGGSGAIPVRTGSSVRSRSQSGSAGQYRSSHPGRPELNIISSSLPPDSLPLVLPPDSPRRLSHKSPRKTISRIGGGDMGVPVQPLVLKRQSVTRLDMSKVGGERESSGRIVSSPTGARSLSGRMSSQCSGSASLRGGRGDVGGIGNGQDAGNGNGVEEVTVIPAQSASYTLPGPSGKGRSLSGRVGAGSVVDVGSVSAFAGKASAGQASAGQEAQGSASAAASTVKVGASQPGVVFSVAGAAGGPSHIAHAQPTGSSGSRNVSGSSARSTAPAARSTHTATTTATTPTPPGSTVHPLKSTAPAISIFNHRFTGPHDGGDSDDSSEASRMGVGIGRSGLGMGTAGSGAGPGGLGERGYMVVENEWRGGMGADGKEGKGWGEEGKRRWLPKGLKPRRS